MASQNIAVPGALCGTLHHCLHKSPCFSGVAIIDEVSQIPLVLWAAILKWQLSGARFICLGDFRSQFGPAFNRWRQETVDQCVEESTFSKTCATAIASTSQLIGAVAIQVFPTIHRDGQQAFYNVYAASHATIPQETWPARLESHRQQRRKAQHKQKLNNELHNTKGGIWIEAAHQLDRQGFWLFPSLHLVGCATDAGVYNGQLYTAMAAPTDLLRLQV